MSRIELIGWVCAILNVAMVVYNIYQYKKNTTESREERAKLSHISITRWGDDLTVTKDNLNEWYPSLDDLYLQEGELPKYEDPKGAKLYALHRNKEVLRYLERYSEQLYAASVRFVNKFYHSVSYYRKNWHNGVGCRNFKVV